MTPRPKPGILDIAPYVQGRAAAATPEGVRVHKLSSNESPLGASPKAIEAYRAAAASLHLYPDGGATALRKALGEAHGLEPARLVCGAGSDELLHVIATCYAGPGDEVLHSAHGFLMYPICAKAAGAVPVAAPEKNFTTDVDALLARVSSRTKILFLANPNNPTGTYIPATEMKRLHAGLPEDVLLVIDAAYAEYVTDKDYEPGSELARSAGNVAMLRTFSKIYGLAALRVGWAYAPLAVADALNRARGPFNLSSAAQAAAVAALADRAHTEAAFAHNARWLPWLKNEIESAGLKVIPSAGNFLLIHFPGTPARGAEAADAFLIKRGLILREVKVYGLPNCLRLTVGTEEENRLVAQALKDFTAGWN